ncbi:MAG: hydrolase [Ramlibacter sp.]|nr:hydrolase [Ramlibacter sp.]
MRAKPQTMDRPSHLSRGGGNSNRVAAGDISKGQTMPNIATPTPGAALLTPQDHTLLMIDFQSQMAFATHSIDGNALRTNAALVANAAAGFKVSTILTTVAEKSFSGPMFAEVLQPFPSHPVLDRTSMNSWEDRHVIEQVNAIGKKRIVLAGLWTSVCIVGPALSAIEQGHQVYVIADACGDVSDEAHDCAMQRMVQAGAQPMTALQYLLELQRDWARTETYGMTTGIAARLGGAYGLGIIYAKTMFGGHEG